MEIGAQLFTLREFCKTKEAFADTLKRVADIGYKNIQVSGTCEYEPEWLDAQLKANGLKCVLTHIPADKLRDSTAKVAADHNIFGCRYIGLGMYGFSEENIYEKFFDAYKPVADTLHANGKYFMYHNHDGEFQHRNGKTILENILEDFAPEKLGITMDVFWVQAGGGNPADWLEKASGRVPCIHLKDFAYGKKMAVLGEGNLNFDSIFASAESAGTKYMLVEQDDCNGEDPFDCLQRSYDFLKSRGF